MRSAMRTAIDRIDGVADGLVKLVKDANQADDGRIQPADSQDLRRCVGSPAESFGQLRLAVSALPTRAIGLPSTDSLGAWRGWRKTRTFGRLTALWARRRRGSAAEAAALIYQHNFQFRAHCPPNCLLGLSAKHAAGTGVNSLPNRNFAQVRREEDFDREPFH